MKLRAWKLRTPNHGVEPSRSRSSIENSSGSDFISQYCMGPRSSSDNMRQTAASLYKQGGAMSSALPDPNALHLVALARRSFEHAHAPYSRFRVGAAVMDERGRAFTGANVENASFGLSMCAERVAIFSAIAAGAHAITAVAVSAERSADVTPCGACRQVMAEFCKPDVPVWCDA